MKRIFALPLLLIISLSIYADRSIQQLYNQLDTAIANKNKYCQIKEKRIASLRYAYISANSSAKRFKIMLNMAEEYRTFNNDSTITCLQHGVEIAEAMKDKQRADFCRSLLAYQYANSGFYTESMVILNRVSLDKCDKATMTEYYKSKGFLYDQLSMYSKIQSDKAYFQSVSDSANNALLKIIPKESTFYFTTVFVRHSDKGEYPQALKTCNEWAKNVKEGTHEYAIMMYYRYCALSKLGETEKAERCLLQSAICDVETATYNETAIFNICQILKDRGDVKRAQTYMKYAYAAAISFGGKIRDNITHDLENVNSKYITDLNEKQQFVNRAFIAIAILFSLTFALLIYSWSQHKKLTSQKEKVEYMLHQLQENNKQLSRLAEQNKVANQKLVEVNIIKDKYIGIFFGFCSSYINLTDKTLKSVNRLLRNKQYDDLYQMSKSTELKENAINELYSKFDEIFLSMFPTFVQSFNDLLCPKARIVVKKQDSLNTPLRIFALIRLGVEESSKISELLNLALSTVYNYRTKYRNEALNGRATFEDEVKKIGIKITNAQDD